MRRAWVNVIEDAYFREHYATESMRYQIALRAANKGIARLRRKLARVRKEALAERHKLCHQIGLSEHALHQERKARALGDSEEGKGS